MNSWFSIFVVFALLHTAFYTTFRNDIFEWNADPSDGNRKSLKKKLDIINGRVTDDKPPKAWVFEHYYHVFLGLVLGWVLVGILLNKHGVFCSQLRIARFDISDLILFVGGWIGINGRLPTIAHDVQNWFKR